MHRVLAPFVAAILALAVRAEAREAGLAHREVRLRRVEAGVGRCTSDRVCTFTRENGTVLRGASTLSGADDARASRRSRPRRTVLPSA